MIFICIIITLIFNPSVYSNTILVPRDFNSIQDAINSSFNGDVIIVSPGTYFENIDFMGKEIAVQSEKGPDFTIIDGCQNGSVVTFINGEKSTSVLNGFTITNGIGTQFGTVYYGGGICCYNKSSPRVLNNIINKNMADAGGGIACSDIECDPDIINCNVSDNIAFSIGGGGILLRGSNAIIDNCIIKRNNSDSFGGGINIKNECKPILSNNIIEMNMANGPGGGICATSAPQPTIIQNVIKNNKARKGGGIFFYDGYVGDNLIIMNVAEEVWNTYLIGYGGGIQVHGNNSEICRNMIAYNSAGSFGGGIDIRSFGGILNGNIICYNSVLDGTYPPEMTRGGGVYIGFNSNILINNSLIYNNTSNDRGAGIFIAQWSSAKINNTTIVNNCSILGGGIYLSDNANLNIANNIIWKNRTDQIYYENLKPDVSYSDIMGGFSGTGNIDADPMFVDEASYDFHILYNSPCRNTGNSNVSNLPDSDFEGDPRNAYGNVDMGADEFHPHIYYTGDATPLGHVEMMITGLPGTQINAVLRSFDVYESPIPCDYGYWHLNDPVQIITGLGNISSNGIAKFVGVIPNRPYPPYNVYLQAVIDYQLTNLCTLKVE